jgi:hypothetical protein
MDTTFACFLKAKNNAKSLLNNATVYALTATF